MSNQLQHGKEKLAIGKQNLQSPNKCFQAMTLFLLKLNYMPDFLPPRSGRKEATQGMFLLFDVGLYSAVKIKITLK